MLMGDKNEGWLIIESAFVVFDIEITVSGNCYDAFVRYSPGIHIHFPELGEGLALENNTCEIIAITKHTRPDARHTVRYRHTRQPVAIIERTISDTHYAVADYHISKVVAIIERVLSNTSDICTNFNSLRRFNPSIHIIIIQPSIYHRLIVYFPRPVILLGCTICESNPGLGSVLDATTCCYGDVSTIQFVYGYHFIFTSF